MQELADARRDGYVVGDVLDVLDTVRRWMEGRVVQVDPKKGYLINYLGWSEKWNGRMNAEANRGREENEAAHRANNRLTRVDSDACIVCYRMGAG